MDELIKKLNAISDQVGLVLVKLDSAVKKRDFVEAHNLLIEFYIIRFLQLNATDNIIDNFYQCPFGMTHSPFDKPELLKLRQQLAENQIEIIHGIIPKSFNFIHKYCV